MTIWLTWMTNPTDTWLIYMAKYNWIYRLRKVEVWIIVSKFLYDCSLSLQFYFSFVIKGGIKGIAIHTTSSNLHRESSGVWIPTHIHPYNGQLDFVTWEVSEVSNFGNFLRLKLFLKALHLHTFTYLQVQTFTGYSSLILFRKLFGLHISLFKS